MNNETVFLTGGTGFTGSYVARRLLEAGFRVRALVRPSSHQAHLPARVDRHIGLLEDSVALERGLNGCDVLVNVASIGFGHAPGIVAAARSAKVRRAIFFSTTSLFTRLNAQSKSIRLSAEECVMSSGLDWTILRPTMIYGSSRDRNLSRLVRFVQHAPIVPVFGPGLSLQQPVYVDDLALAVVSALREPATVGRAYNLPGAAPLNYNCMLDVIASLLGKRARLLHLPAEPLVHLLRFWESKGLPTPLKAEQIQRLNEDKHFDYTEARRDFAYSPRTFAEGIRQEVIDMGLLNVCARQSSVDG